MEEEALQPGGSAETLLGRLFSYYGPAEGESKGEEKVETRTDNLRNPVTYISYKIFKENVCF